MSLFSRRFKSAHPMPGPFRSLQDINWRADRILGKWSAEEVRETVSLFREEFKKYRDNILEHEFDLYVQRLHDKGGWELNYLPDEFDGRHPSHREIRYLLNNWPSYVADKPDIPSNHYVREFDDLQRAIDDDYFSESGNLPGLSSAEAYALMTKIKTEDVASLLYIEEKLTADGIPIHAGQYPWDKQSIVFAADLIIEAMEIICFAERAFTDAQLRENRAAQMSEVDRTVAVEVTTILREERKVAAKAGGDKKAEKTKWVEPAVLSLLDAGPWKSAAHAAGTITPIVVDMSRGRGDLASTTALPLRIIRNHWAVLRSSSAK